MSKSLPCFAALIVALGTSVSVQAVPLTTGIVPIPTPNPGIPVEVFPSPPTAIAGGFSQTWSSPAQANWVGTFTMTGVKPNTTPGTTTYDFTGLPLGVLPAGSIIRIGDLDKGGGSNNEQFTLSGTRNCSNCFPPLGSFLEEPFGVTDAIGDFTPSLAEMPSVTVSSGFSSNIYLFDGGAVTANNPGIGFAMRTSQSLTTLTVVKSNSANNLNILAPPVPEPASAAMIGLGTLALLGKRRSAG